jgi:16S rRNA (cytidine1402-2'-O)-methyltransferase
MPGTLFVVATPIGNLDDISGRALRVLRDVALIAAEDTRRTARLLARYAIATPTTSLYAHNEGRKVPGLLERLARGEDLALVSDAGTPTVSDPGDRLIRAAIDAGFRVEPIPGPSAAMAALAVSGIAAPTFTFMGFPPIRAKDRDAWFQEVRNAGRTVIFFEAPHRINKTLGHLMDIVGDCRVCVARELTKTHEELVRGPISVVLPVLAEPRGEYTVVMEIGPTPAILTPDRLDDRVAANELGELTKNLRIGRRKAIGVIATRYGRTPNEIYAAVERAKKSGG